MAESSSAQERTEDATPKRKQDARKKGSVAKSQELVSALVLGSLLIVLPPTIANVGGALKTSFQQSAREIPDKIDFAHLSSFVGKVATGPLMAFLPLVAVVMTVGILANFAQVGFMLTPEGLKPKWEKLNPLAGLKRMFSRQAGMEGLKAAVKTSLFGYLAYSAIHDRWDKLTSLAWIDTADSFGFAGETMQVIATRVGMAWLVLAALDYFFQRKQLDRQLKMTKDEVRQEFKETEQSPEIKGAMARRRRRMSKGRPMEAVKTADVVITNPTHFAVALKYQPGSMHAPQVVAKGVDFLAARIREEAQAHKIPILPNPPLARTLYRKCEVGDFVPRDMFQAVAEVLAFVYKTVGQKRAA